jgi:adenosylcobyric acid synthase
MLVNKFRGDPALFAQGLREIEARCRVPALGLVPWFAAAARLPAEDAAGLDSRRFDLGGPRTAKRLKIAVLRLPRIANFDDLDPLGMEPGVRLVFVGPGEPIPVCDVVILPGSKSTIGDLAFLRAQGWDIDLAAHVRRGGHVIGLCGGYQMLGRKVRDPDGLEGPPGEVAGLGLLDVETTLTGDKITAPVHGTHIATGAAIGGYEIHLGRTTGPGCARPMVDLGGRADGAVSADGRIAGCYVHGLFGADGFRRAWLAGFGLASTLAYETRVEAALDALADHVETHLDIDQLLAIAQARPKARAATTSA